MCALVISMQAADAERRCAVSWLVRASSLFVTEIATVRSLDLAGARRLSLGRQRAGLELAIHVKPAERSFVPMLAYALPTDRTWALATIQRSISTAPL